MLFVGSNNNNVQCTVSIDSTMICQDKWNTFFSSFNHVRYKQLKFKTEHLLHTIIHS